MQQLFTKVRSEISAFIEQTRNLVLLISASDADSGFLLSIVKDIESSNDTDIILVFSHAFGDQRDYVSQIVTNMQQQHAQANQMMAEAGKIPLAPIPTYLLDQNQSPVLRLRGAIQFAHSLLPKEGGHRLAVVLCPTGIGDRRRYLEFITNLISHKTVEPWMRGVRLIIREEPDTREFAPAIVKFPRLKLFSADFSPQALEKSLEEAITDPESSEDERIQSLLASAQMDYAYNRLRDAIEKYRYLLSYYQYKNNLQMQAYIMNCLGDLHHHRTGDLPSAQYWYECAVPPIAKDPQPVLFHTIVRNLADVAFKQTNYPFSEQVYEKAVELAQYVPTPETKIRDMEYLGLSQERQKKLREAVTTWEEAVKACREMDIVELHSAERAVLSHLARVYKAAGSREGVARTEAAIANLDKHRS
jgi:tetratricopeptide (TPR) repeat protein